MADKTFEANYLTFKQRITDFQRNIGSAANGHGEFKTMQKGDLDSHLASFEASIRFFKSVTSSPKLTKILNGLDEVFKELYHLTNSLKSKDLVFVSKLNGGLSVAGRQINSIVNYGALTAWLQEFYAAVTTEKLI